MPTDRGVAQLPLFGVGAGVPAGPAGQTPAATLDIHAVSIPARAFTGDFYFTHRYADRLWFALGDVAGKGLNAAVVMAMIQEELEELTDYDPSGTMLRLHTFLRPLMPRNRFATAVIGHLCEDGTLTLVNAGHCAPLIARADGRIEAIDSTGPVVGLLQASEWRSRQTTLAPGETLVLYSDGLLESHSPEGEEFGASRIEAALRGNSAREIADGLLEAANQHSGGIHEDDLTLVVVRIGRES
jgi:phosphoserine phosphatase RsbU/P